jgi:biopolymer transport protein ExbB
VSLSHLASLAAASGGILYTMPVLLLITLTVSFERVWFLARLRASGSRVIQRVAGLAHLDRAELDSLLQQTEGQPIAQVLRVPLRFPEVRDHARLGDLLEEAILREVPNMDRFVWVLDTSVTLAPLLGLLGTIIGMFNAFQVLGNPGTAPTEITGGIAEALIATASGLLIAIIGLIFLNALQVRVRLLVHDMETLKMMLINRLDGSVHTVERLEPRQRRVNERGA